MNRFLYAFLIPTHENIHIKERDRYNKIRFSYRARLLYTGLAVGTYALNFFYAKYFYHAQSHEVSDLLVFVHKKIRHRH